MTKDRTMKSVAASLAILCLADATTYDIRDTSLGAVQGILNETSRCREWKGVFFAADTGGDNRWLPPQPREPWVEVANATTFGAGCSQIHHNPDVPTIQSEDCLNLNVFVPERCAAGADCKLPVLIWFYGGTFCEGFAEGPFDLYDGCNMAQGGDVVVVTANYRLGSFGFLVTTSSEGEYDLRGNQGFLDQRAAMEWVQANAASFGGDPGSVTLFGQSAGAMSVGLHYVSPPMFESGLFHKVIMESNYPGSNIHDLDEASKLGNDFCRALGCFDHNLTSCDATCMRAANTSAVEQAWKDSSGDVLPWVYDNMKTWQLLDGAMSFAPVVDGDLIPCKITDCLSQGSFNVDIPALFGTNTGDGATFVYYIDEPLPYWALAAMVDVVWAEPPGTAQRILDNYEPLFPRNSTPDARVPISQVVNDYLFRCGSEVYGREVSKAGGTAFEYVFDHVYSHSELFPLFGLPDVCTEVACHCEEIIFVFNNTVPSLNASFTDDEQVLAQQMVTWWANFARYGDPNGQGTPDDLVQAPTWPQFVDSSTAAARGAKSELSPRSAMHVSTPQSYVESGGEGLCSDLWDSIGYGY